MTFTPTKPHFDTATNTFTADEPVTNPYDVTYAVQVPDEADASGDSLLDDNFEADSPLDQLAANEA